MKSRWLNPSLIWVALIASSFALVWANETHCVYNQSMEWGCDTQPLFYMMFPNYLVVLLRDIQMNPWGQFVTLAIIDSLLIMMLLKIGKRFHASLKWAIIGTLIYVSVSLLFDILVMSLYLSGATAVGGV